MSIVSKEETIETAPFIPILWMVSVHYVISNVCPRNFQVSVGSLYDSNMYVIGSNELQGTSPDSQPENILTFYIILGGSQDDVM